MRRHLRSARPVGRAKVRQLAGLATWIAGILAQFTVFTARLWAATATEQVYINPHQILTPVKGLRTLGGRSLESIENHCRTPTGNFSLITGDASLNGGGATLHAGLRALDEAANKPRVRIGTQTGPSTIWQRCGPRGARQADEPSWKLAPCLPASPHGQKCGSKHKGRSTTEERRWASYRACCGSKQGTCA